MFRINLLSRDRFRLPSLKCGHNLRDCTGPSIICPRCGERNDLNKTEQWTECFAFSRILKKCYATLGGLVYCHFVLLLLAGMILGSWRDGFFALAIPAAGFFVYMAYEIYLREAPLAIKNHYRCGFSTFDFFAAAFLSLISLLFCVLFAVFIGQRAMRAGWQIPVQNIAALTVLGWIGFATYKLYHRLTPSSAMIDEHITRVQDHCIVETNR